MTQYADYDYYINDYLHGQEAMSRDDFDFFAVRASKVIERHTFSRIEEVTEAIKSCCCELAECLQSEYSADNQNGETSESVGSYSVSYASATDRHRESQQEYSRILHLWLGDTGLLYRG